jgi:hypothetical protein
LLDQRRSEGHEKVVGLLHTSLQQGKHSYSIC